MVDATDPYIQFQRYIFLGTLVSHSNYRKCTSLALKIVVKIYIFLKKINDTMGKLLFSPHHIPCHAVLQQKSLTALSQLEQAEEARDAKERRRRSRVQIKSRMLFRTKKSL